MTIEVWYPLGVAGAGASFAASGLVTSRSRVNVGLLSAAAAGALNAIVALDLLPDVRTNARAAGIAPLVLIGSALVMVTALWLPARRRRRRPPAPGTALVGPAFLLHGFVEGIVGGTVIGWRTSVGIGLVVALVLHKAAEGADVAAALRGVTGSGQDPMPRGRRWLLGGAAAPLLGCGVAIVLPLPEQVGAVVMTAVCCVLVRASLLLLGRSLKLAGRSEVVAAAALGAAAMSAVIGLG